MSFLPVDYLEKRIQRRTNIISLTLFVVVMGGVVAAYFVTDRQREDIEQQQLYVNSQFVEAAKRLEQLEVLQERKQQMIHKAQVTGTLVERIPRTLVLSELINNMPITMNLTELGLETRVLQRRRVGRSALESAKAKAGAKAKRSEPTVVPTEVSMLLMGNAPTDVDVAQYMASLGRNVLFSDVNLGFSDEAVVDGENMRKFRIELVLNQELDLQKFEPTKVARDRDQKDAAGGLIKMFTDRLRGSDDDERDDTVRAND